jgi:hypothetical protein
MTYCPSQDWDRHIDELDAAAEAEMRFYKEHGDAIERIAIALIQYAMPVSGPTDELALVKKAARIASLIYAEQEE